MARKRKTLTEQLRELIEKDEKSRYRIAKETGLTEPALCRFVKGRMGLTLANADRIAKCLNLALVKRGTK